MGVKVIPSPNASSQDGVFVAHDAPHVDFAKTTTQKPDCCMMILSELLLPFDNYTMPKQQQQQQQHKITTTTTVTPPGNGSSSLSSSSSSPKQRKKNWSSSTATATASNSPNITTMATSNNDDAATATTTADANAIHHYRHRYPINSQLHIHINAKTHLAIRDLPPDLKTEVLGRDFDDRDKPLIYDNKTYFPIHFYKRDLYTSFTKINSSGGWTRQVSLHNKTVKPIYVYVGEHTVNNRFIIRMILHDKQHHADLMEAFPVKIPSPSTTETIRKDVDNQTTTDISIGDDFTKDESSSEESSVYDGITTTNDTSYDTTTTYNDDTTTIGSNSNDGDNDDGRFLNLDLDNELAAFKQLLSIF